MTNKRIILSLLFILCITNFLYSQITIGKIEKQKKDTVILKPTPYDSLNDFHVIIPLPFNPTNEIDYYQYKKYIGCKFYLPPLKNARYSDGINFLYSITPSYNDTSISIISEESYIYNKINNKYENSIKNYKKIITHIYKPFI